MGTPTQTDRTLDAHVDLMTADQLLRFTTVRPLETKLGQVLRCHVEVLDPTETLNEELAMRCAAGVRYVLFGNPDGISPVANYGRRGAEGGWEAFCSVFCNMQSNGLLPERKLLLLGQTKIADLTAKGRFLGHQKTDELHQLRQLTAEIDGRVTPLVRAIVKTGMVPIMIGGGHAGAYPLIRGTSEAVGKRVGVVNCDPHADFRPIEDGRHSGNGFSFAYSENLMRGYYILGLDERYNSRIVLETMTENNRGASRPIKWTTMQDVRLGRVNWDHAIYDAEHFVNKVGGGGPIGVELDLDAITGVPASAINLNGLTMAQAECYLYRLSALKPAYIHLAEGAPALDPSGDLATGKKHVGRVLADLVCAAIAGLEQKRD